MKPNLMMLEFLVCTKEGLTAFPDPLDVSLCRGVAVENGWLTIDFQLTEEGERLTSKLSVGTAEKARKIPTLLLAAYQELYIEGKPVEDFEKRYEIPFRSGKVVKKIAIELFLQGDN